MYTKSHILIVDDDKQICDLVSDYFMQHGFKVSIAHDGRQMRRVLRDAVIDLIILFQIEFQQNTNENRDHQLYSTIEIWLSHNHHHSNFLNI